MANSKPKWMKEDLPTMTTGDVTLYQAKSLKLTFVWEHTSSFSRYKSHYWRSDNPNRQDTSVILYLYLKSGLSLPWNPGGKILSVWQIWLRLISCLWYWSPNPFKKTAKQGVQWFNMKWIRVQNNTPLQFPQLGRRWIWDKELRVGHQTWEEFQSWSCTPLLAKSRLERRLIFSLLLTSYLQCSTTHSK